MTKTVWVDVQTGHMTLKQRESVDLANGSYSFRKGESGVIDLALTTIGNRLLEPSSQAAPSSAVLSVTVTGGDRSTKTIHIS